MTFTIKAICPFLNVSPVYEDIDSSAVGRLEQFHVTYEIMSHKLVPKLLDKA